MYTIQIAGMYKILAMLAVSLTVLINSNGQTSNEIKALIDSARVYYYLDGDKTLTFSREAYRLAEKDNDYWGMLNATQLIGEGYFTLGKYDSAMMSYDFAMELAVANNDTREIANNFISKSSIASSAGEYADALGFMDKGIAEFRRLKDTSALCDALVRKGNIYSLQGYHEKAIECFLESVRNCELAGSTTNVGYNYGALGIIYDKQREFDKALEYNQKALELFIGLDDDFGKAGILNNMGILYKNMGDYSKAIDAYNKALELCEKLEMQQGISSCQTNLAILYNKLGEHEAADQYALEGLRVALETNNRESAQDNLNSLALAQLGLRNYSQAEDYALQSLEIATDLGSLEKLRDVNETLSKIYSAKGMYRDALDHYHTYTELNDSIFNLERSRQINELQTIYETEKKDNAIQLLAKNAEIDRVKKTRLWIGLGLSLLLGTFMVYGQWDRRRHDRKIHLQEQEIEAQKRRNTELENERLASELDYKQKELTAKVLQLARKNEFLQGLNDRVRDIREQTEGAAKDEARRLSNMIDRDVESETDWDDFLASFREVHNDFMDALNNQYQDLSKSDLKLACLMKMNMSSKEIASLLNISSEGVKKARYRLRKKLELDADSNIQEYLIAFPAV